MKAYGAADGGVAVVDVTNARHRRNRQVTCRPSIAATTACTSHPAAAAFSATSSPASGRYGTPPSRGHLGGHGLRPVFYSANTTVDDPPAA